MGVDVVNEAIGAGVVPTSRLVSLQLRLDDLGQLFAKFNTYCVQVLNIWKLQEVHRVCKVMNSELWTGTYRPSHMYHSHVICNPRTTVFCWYAAIVDSIIVPPLVTTHLGINCWHPYRVYINCYYRLRQHCLLTLVLFTWFSTCLEVSSKPVQVLG